MVAFVVVARLLELLEVDTLVEVDVVELDLG